MPLLDVDTPGLSTGPGDAFVLPPSLDPSAAEELYRQLLDRVLLARPLVIEASGVQRISTQCAQVLVAAARGARRRGLPFALHAPSEILMDGMVQLGLEKDLGGED